VAGVRERRDDAGGCRGIRGEEGERRARTRHDAGERAGVDPRARTSAVRTQRQRRLLEIVADRRREAAASPDRSACRTAGSACGRPRAGAMSGSALSRSSSPYTVGVDSPPVTSTQSNRPRARAERARRPDRCRWRCRRARRRARPHRGRRRAPEVRAASDRRRAAR
jgi:hypothetical protein